MQTHETNSPCALVAVSHWYPSTDLPLLLNRGDIQSAIIAPVTYLIVAAPWPVSCLAAAAAVMGAIPFALWAGIIPLRTGGPGGKGGPWHRHAPGVDAMYVCHGKQRELDALSVPQRGFFEPAIIRFVSFPPIMTEWVLRVVAAVAIVLGMKWLSLSYWTVSIALFVTMLLLAGGRWLRPGCYRVTPGEIEVLRGRYPRSCIHVEDSISLKDARIVCRYDARILEITPNTSGGVQKSQGVGQRDRSQEVLAIDLRNVDAPHALVKAVFWAAVSADTAPPLGHDELLG